MLTGKRIFVVEDEAMVAMMVERWLENMGCVVAGTASRLPEGLEQARTIEIDAAVLDVNLAGELSYPIGEILLRRNIPVVFSTGYGAAGLTGHLREAQVLAKPYQQEQLGNALRIAFTKVDLARGSTPS
ncbi:response regulator (plasmid) [Rhizobium sp. 32-5/1]|uniref:response regulator n=1 Tax=Rhizobium sp. 32-5/1 TaxID=3019602 RepID=UPI00240D3AC0|nr:response regulator [Rhizobium sp. 32-5/1]WEZ85995.1 response regulator [Rhizobium sp. 32-5/1]